jgi:hypothetical protein
MNLSPFLARGSPASDQKEGLMTERLEEIEPLAADVREIGNESLGYRKQIA